MSVLALDLGGTTVKAALVDKDGTLLAEHRVPSGERAGLATWRQAALHAATSLLAGAAEPPVAMGLSVPGAVDPQTCTLLDLVDRLPEGNGLDLRRCFVDLGLPTWADCDSRAGLRAERRWGLARGVDNVALLTIGTGLGGAVLCAGRPPGSDPVLAGVQIGHFTIDVTGTRCVCGNRGCGETLVSGPALVRRARQLGLDAADAAAVFACDAVADRAAMAAVEEFIDALAAIVVTVIHAYQPDLVVLAGGVL
ncbi:MAG: ROK family protein, partial [Mycobacteriales bacterium]